MPEDIITAVDDLESAPEAAPVPTKFDYLNTYDLNSVVRRIPSDVRELVKLRGLFVAGGLIRAVVAGEEVSDIDILAVSRTEARAAAEELVRQRGPVARMFRTKNAFTVLQNGKTPVQFIHRWTFSAADELINSFDYTIAQAVVYFRDMVWQSLLAETFYMDLAAKRLRYTSPVRHEDAGGSLLRMQKFIRRGYSIAPEDMARVIARLLSGVRDSRLALENESGTARVLAGLLREVDPLTIIDGVPTDDSLAPENQDEDEVF